MDKHKTFANVQAFELLAPSLEVLEIDGEVWDLVLWKPGRLRVYRSRSSGSLLVYELP